MLPVFLIFFGFLIVELIIPGWKQPKVRDWPVRAIAVNLVQLGMMLLSGYTWGKWFSSFSLFRLSDHVGPVVGGFLVYFISTFVFYWWHRWRHESTFLWRVFHQIHHSPQRVEVLGAYYKHPGEMIANSMIASCLAFAVLGLGPAAGGYFSIFSTVGDCFTHANIRTPRWIGYFFQRPEMHRIHHRYQVHRNNYSDITWWDMLFGTYENPKEANHLCGFDEERERRLTEMLMARDVHAEGKSPEA